MKITLEILTDTDVDKAIAMLQKLQRPAFIKHKVVAEKAELARTAKIQEEYRKGLSLEPVSLISDKLSTRTQNCLLSGKIETMGQLMNTTQKELLKTPNLGINSLREILLAVANYGIQIP